MEFNIFLCKILFQDKYVIFRFHIVIYGLYVVGLAADHPASHLVLCRGIEWN